MLLGDLLRLSAARHPRKPALVCAGDTLTYGTLDAAADRLAHALVAHGVGRGEPVAVLSRNRAEYVVALFGAARAGAVLLALSPLSSAAELGRILALTEARTILFEPEFEPLLADAAVACPALRHRIAFGTAAGAASFADLVAGMPDAPAGVAVEPGDPVAMTFTGGTTGAPKGTVVSHRARVASAIATAIEHELAGNDVVGVVTPLYHAIGLLVWLPAAIAVGATAVLLPRWDAAGFADACAAHAITAALMVPVQARQLVADGIDPARLASLRKLATGGAPMPPDLPPAVAARLPWASLTDHYGQSETGPLTVLKPWHPADKAGTIGVPAFGVELRLLDGEGRPVPDGAVGEIVVRGDCLMTGYWRDAAETAGYFRRGDGWGWTGDLATRDADGFLTLVGRSKEMVISGGMNVYPREIELTLAGHHAVDECAAFGVPDPTWGEAVVACVVLRHGRAASADELVAYCGANLARYKRPKAVRFVDAIPKTASGKVVKASLRAAYLADTSPR